MFGRLIPDPEVVPEFRKNLNDMTTEEKIERADVLLRELNDLWASLPRNYSMWIDWNSRPRRVTMTDRVNIDRNVIAPR